MKCTKCGNEQKDGDFCTNCGAPMQKPHYNVPPQQNQAQIRCPRCGSTHIVYQREQTGNIGAGTNTIVIQEAKRSKGCLYWFLIGWWWVPLYWICIGWWKVLLFGGVKKPGINIGGSKNFNSTMAICQNCGNTWKAS